MTSVGDPVGTGLVDSLARPGGNITGNTTIIGEMAGKRLELLKQLVPHLSRVAVLGHPGDPIVAVQMRHAEAVAARVHETAVSHRGEQEGQRQVEAQPASPQIALRNATAWRGRNVTSSKARQFSRSVTSPSAPPSR